MKNSALKLYMIPGTGTDYRMYTPQLEEFPDMIIPAWLQPLNLNESLESYAGRLAESIDTSSPFALGGVSLGGMIAQQMSFSVKPVGLILIATASDSKALPFLFRLSGKIMRFMPNIIVKLMFALLAKIITFERFKNKEIYAQMLKDMSPQLVRWQSFVSTKWTLKRPLKVSVFQIHGQKDNVINIKNVNAQSVIPDGGHLINVTHKKQVNDFIKESMLKLSY